MQRFIQTISEDLLDGIQLIKMYVSSILMKNIPEHFFLFYRMTVLNMKPWNPYIKKKYCLLQSSVHEYFMAQV
jgi:hypothetical protein